MAGVGADGVAGGRRCGAADEEAPSQYWGGRPYRLPLAAAALAAAVLPPEAGVAGRAPGRLLAGALAAAAPAEIAAREEAAAEAAAAAAVAEAAEEADEEEADDRVADDEVEGEVAARAGSLVGELMGSMR
jgi:hypothetical protein